jgi:hypothetical protein
MSDILKVTPPSGIVFCANCLAFDLYSPAIKGWEGAPICREHAAEFIANSLPPIEPPPGGFAPTTLRLQ